MDERSDETRVERFGMGQVQLKSLSLRTIADRASMSQFSRRLLPLGGLVLLLIVVSACREAPQPALNPQALFPVEVNDQWGYVTATGRLAINPRFERAYRFVDDRARIRTDGHFGFIDTTGSVVISPAFSNAGRFSDGRAPVQQDSLWGFIDRTGRLVVEPRFGLDGRAQGVAPPDTADQSPNASRADTVLVPSSGLQHFPAGRARIRTEGEWGFINRNGAVVISPRFAHAWPFQNGRARVRIPSGTMGYVTPAGSLVWPPDSKSSSSPPSSRTAH